MTSPAQRKAAERDRKRSAGLVPLEVWTRPEHKAAIQKYAVRKNKITTPPIDSIPTTGARSGRGVTSVAAGVI